METRSDNYWWLIIVVAAIVIFLVILIMLLTKKTYEREDCNSAEYPTIAENISNDPNIVEVSLTSSDNEVQILNGDLTKLYNYNKSFPGPLIEAKKGDILIVHFFNDISQPSTINFHGLMPSANMDGSRISQYPVQPGDSFTYEFILTTAGLFYYHSDINAREQVSMGLFGAILVHDHREDQKYSLPENEKVLAFSDLKLNNNNQVDIAFSSQPCERASQEVNGIIGNVLLTNGVSNGCISVPRNAPVRLRMVNAATDRFMKISIQGHDMLKIGGDQGLLEKPLLIKDGNGLMLTTGERADVVFVPRTEKVELYTDANPRGIQEVVKDSTGNCELTDKVEISDQKLLLVTFKTFEEKAEIKLEVPLELQKIRKIDVDHCTPVIPVKFGGSEIDSEGNIDFYAFKVDGEGIPFDYLTPKQAPIVFEDGTYIIEVTNYSLLANNFHLHGFTFQHLDTLFITKGHQERIENKILENKDTIYIPARPTNGRSKTVVRLAVEFNSKHREIIAYGKQPTEKRSGGWIFQSNILTHSELGQAGFIQIVAECDRSDYLTSSGYINSYSSYSSGDHTTCLTSNSSNRSNSSNCSNSSRSSRSSRYSKRSRYSDSKDSYSKDSYSKDSYSKDNYSISRETYETLDSMTKSFIKCSCGSGLSDDSCCNSSSRRDTLSSRLSKSKSSLTDSDFTDSKLTNSSE